MSVNPLGFEMDGYSQKTGILSGAFIIATSWKESIYGTRRFITVFTKALHWPVSWARSVQSIPPRPM
jgi:hypothetical protein